MSPSYISPDTRHTLIWIEMVIFTIIVVDLKVMEEISCQILEFTGSNQSDSCYCQNIIWLPNP